METDDEFEYYHNIAGRGDLDAIKQCFSQSLSPDIQRLLISLLVNNGHLNCLQYLNSIGIEFDSQDLFYSASYGHLECLKYLYETVGLRYEEKRVTAVAAYSGQLECLQYLHSKHFEWNKRATSGAALRGHLDCLQYLHENGCEWDRNTVYSAAINGYIECLKYAYQNGCELYKNATLDAIENGYLDCFQYLVEQGCEVSDFSIKYLERYVSEINLDECVWRTLLFSRDLSTTPELERLVGQKKQEIEHMKQESECLYTFLPKDVVTYIIHPYL